MIRRAFPVAVSLGVLGALALLAPPWHLGVGAAGWLLLRFPAPDLARSVGRPARWLAALGGLVLLGAWLGPVDHHTAGVPWSAPGAWAATTMVVRAFALVVLASSLTAAVPLRRWLGASRLPVVRRLVEVVVVAANLVPVLLRALGDARSSLRERRPGLRRLPRRVRLLGIHAVVRAANLADAVAFDMAIGAHNAGVSLPTSKEDS